jgi:SAM-dependent methyltransferase
MDPNQKKQLTPEEQAALLRKPEGEGANEIFAYMNRGTVVLYPQMLLACKDLDARAILELGPGNGVLIPGLLEQFPQAQYTGIDYSETCIEAARAANAHMPLEKINLVLGDISTMPFEDANFDLVLGVNVIYFWESAHKTLLEIHRVMKPGARLLLGFRPAHKLGRMEFTRYGFTLYEVSEWEKYMAEAGFKDIQSLLFKEADRFTAEGLLEMECVVCSGNKA